MSRSQSYGNTVLFSEASMLFSAETEPITYPPTISGVHFSLCPPPTLFPVFQKYIYKSLCFCHLMQLPSFFFPHYSGCFLEAQAEALSSSRLSSDPWPQSAISSLCLYGFLAVIDAVWSNDQTCASYVTCVTTEDWGFVLGSLLYPGELA